MVVVSCSLRGRVLTRALMGLIVADFSGLGAGAFAGGKPSRVAKRGASGYEKFQTPPIRFVFLRKSCRYSSQSNTRNAMAADERAERYGRRVTLERVTGF
jgi:hypothetical protein